MDPITMAGIAGAGSGLIGGYLNYKGQKETNQTNVNIAAAANKMNREEAQKNRDWQQAMSNTAKQREAHDLEKAGLNRLLAATGGASTPSGGAASAVTATVENEMSGAISSALEGAKIGIAKQQQLAQLENMNKNNKLIEAQIGKTQMETKIMGKELPKAEIGEAIGNAIKAFLPKAKEAVSTTAKDIKQLKDNFSGKNGPIFNNSTIKLRKP